ncbi:Hypothetical protein POVN_LOCUS697 [uncultured virus]|nr:Hypothetical protein POVN_LOCUS697 [uncultured virus]
MSLSEYKQIVEYLSQVTAILADDYTRRATGQAPSYNITALLDMLPGLSQAETRCRSTLISLDLISGFGSKAVTTETSPESLAKELFSGRAAETTAGPTVLPTTMTGSTPVIGSATSRTPIAREGGTPRMDTTSMVSAQKKAPEAKAVFTQSLMEAKVLKQAPFKVKSITFEVLKADKDGTCWDGFSKQELKQEAPCEECGEESDEDEKDQATKGYLGAGSFGEVYPACKTAAAENDPTRCNYVVKLNAISKEYQQIQARIDYTMLFSLQDRKWLNSAGKVLDLVPRVYNAWLCLDEKFAPNSFSFALDRWDGDLLALAEKQHGLLKTNKLSQRGGTNYIYTLQQFADMLLIAQALDQMDVIHGDLKPNQFLYKDGGTTICVSDFGGTNTYGWGQVRLTCPDVRSTADLIPGNLRSNFNRWQLVTYLATTGICWIVDPATGAEYLFGGTNLSSFYSDLIYTECPNDDVPRARHRDQQWRADMDLGTVPVLNFKLNYAPITSTRDYDPDSAVHFSELETTQRQQDLFRSRQLATPRRSTELQLREADKKQEQAIRTYLTQ